MGLSSWARCRRSASWRPPIVGSTPPAAEAAPCPLRPPAPADPAQANKQFKANRAYQEELQESIKARTGKDLPSLKASPGVGAPVAAGGARGLLRRAALALPSSYPAE